MTTLSRRHQSRAAAKRAAKIILHPKDETPAQKIERVRREWELDEEYDRTHVEGRVVIPGDG